MRLLSTIVFCLAAATAALGAETSPDVQQQETFPPLCVEISADHPLYVFGTSGMNTADPVAYAERVRRAWESLPAAFRAYSAMQVRMDGPDQAARHLRYRALLEALQSMGVPVVARLADGDAGGVYPPNRAEELIREFTCIKGIQAVGLEFNTYETFGGGPAYSTPPQARWLSQAMGLAAQYGRFFLIELDELAWPRIMSNPNCKTLYDRMRTCSAYAVPVARYRGRHVIAQQSALMGLWLEGATDQWGVGPSSDWYTDAGYLAPGMFGRSPDPVAMPAGLYRAMILNGAMTGAAVYSFDKASDLWFGEGAGYWSEAIAPTLSEVFERGLITSRKVTGDKARVAYQLAPAATSQEFHINLRDLDAEFDQGLLMKGAYGMERPGQVTELVPNSGRHFWVPVVSPYAPQEALQSFASIVQPGMMASAESWTELLDRHYRPDGLGTAFICRVGRGLFVMHTRENLYEEQTFRIPGVPSPVTGVEARREDGTVVLKWPFREGDVAYNVYKRPLESASFTLAAELLDIDQRTWVDANVNPDHSIAYSVTALTNEEAPLEGSLNYGDYLALSTVESRIAEEVIITPLLGYGKGRPVDEKANGRPLSQAWWPSYEGVPEEQRPAAEAIVARIEAWDHAFSNEQLDALMELYATDYQDPEGWQFQYARRAYQWFFERYSACTMDRQIRRWEFASTEAAQEVRVLIYCRFAGVALTDASGRQADLPAYFPRTERGEVLVTFVESEGVWRISRTEPALPNFRDILSFSVGPYDSFMGGPDVSLP
jgi:hypothetical protein